MGYIIDSDEDWAVEARDDSVLLATDYGTTEIENKDLPGVASALLEATMRQLVVNCVQPNFFLDTVENFLRTHGRR